MRLRLRRSLPVFPLLVFALGFATHARAQDGAPVVTAPPTVTGSEGALLTFTVSAVDPDGQAIFSLTAAPLPAGATFTTNAANISGTFSWTPSFAQDGNYSVTFTAANELSGSATTLILIGGDSRPVVIAPATVTRPEGCTIEFVVTAFEPSGLTIVSLTAAPLPAGATFTANATNTSGTFHWTTSFTQAGSYSLAFTAVDANGASGSATTGISVTLSARGPVVFAPSSVSVDEGSCVSFVVTAVDPDGDPINCLSPGSGVPVGAAFTSNPAHTSGTFTWCPSQGTAGSYAVTFVACSDICGGTACTICGSATTVINVNRHCDPPIADAGGPYSGPVGAPIEFDGSGSHDPAGEPITLEWDFGDGITGVGTVVSHIYTAPGTYLVTLSVTGTCGSATDQTTATVGQLCATAFTTGGNRTVRLDSGRPTWCAQVEPIGNCYAGADVDLSSIVMQFDGGTASEIRAIADKASINGDRNANGVEEITACFRKEDLRQLFSGVPSGESIVTATLRMGLVTGGQVHAEVLIRVFSSGATLAAQVTPNPFNPRATLSFRTTREGFARATLHDASGRLVRALLNERSMAAGYHDVALDGRTSSGEALPSGVYLYRLETAEGATSGRVVLLK